ncbi:MAG: alpha/beta hydrolase [Pseudomonadota bacterium]
MTPIPTATFALLLAFQPAYAGSAGVPDDDGFSGTSIRADGSTIDWHLDSLPGDRPVGLVLVSQGSGCASTLTNPSIQLLASALGDLTVLTIEKYGVEPWDAPVDPIEDCSATYYANNTISQRVDDAEQVLAELRNADVWNGDLALFGGSSGGPVVAMLGARLPETDAIVVFSAGAGLTLAESLPEVVPPPVEAAIQEQFDRIRLQPDSLEVMSGNSFRWWAGIMDHRPVDDLLAASAPVLLVHGTLDESSPVASARATRDAFAAAGDDRLTYWELQGLDHQMVDTSGTSQMGRVLDSVADWISGRLQQ